jgi:peptidoglycan/LPS O-acetylase OafA/YrhL
MLMVALENLPKLQSLFSLPVAFYVGEISFALHLFHYLVVHTLGESLIFELRNRGVDDVTSAVIGIEVAMAASLWAADIYWRFVDLPAGKFARWIVEKMGV